MQSRRGPLTLWRSKSRRIPVRLVNGAGSFSMPGVNCVSVLSMMLAAPTVVMSLRVARDWMYLRAADKALKSHGVDGVEAMAGYVRALKTGRS